MAGCDIIAVSGIDGNFEQFNRFLGNRLGQYTGLPYHNGYSFMENFENMKAKINPTGNTIILGWSIGAAMALAITGYSCINNCIMINSFFDRKKALSCRGINIDEKNNVSIADFTTNNKNILIIAGSHDDKIRYTESIHIFERLKENNHTELLILSGASHDLSSFPKKLYD